MTGLVVDSLRIPERRVGNDSAAVREVIGPAVGCTAFTLSMIGAVRGRSMERATGGSEEVLFVLRGHGAVVLDGAAHALEPETGVLLGPGARYELDNDRDDDLVLVSVALHEPEREAAGTPALTLARLSDQEAQSATGARTFRIVFDADGGCMTATQFVGYIPVGAAPEHYHLYEEVIYILDGTGVMHMNGTQTPLRGGSCIHLPARNLHTLENSGPGMMRLLGVFRPGGSPAAAFYPDGTSAYPADDPATASAVR